METINLNSEFKNAIKDKYNANIIKYLNLKGYTLETALLELSKVIASKHNISLQGAISVVMYDAGFTLDAFSNCMVDKNNIDFNYVSQFMDNDELSYQIEIM